MMDTENSNINSRVSVAPRRRLRNRLWMLCVAGILIAGTTALGFDYYYVYRPPLKAAEIFMSALETRNREVLKENVLVRGRRAMDELRGPTDSEIELLLSRPFERGRVLDQRRRDGSGRSYHYLVYREPGGQVYALLVSESEGRYHIVIQGSPIVNGELYLWDYVWTN